MVQFQEDFLFDTIYFRLISLVLLIHSSLFAIEASWRHTQLNNPAIISKKPLLQIQKDITKQVDHYLSQRGVINVEKIIPPKIEMPSYPKEIVKPQVLKEVVFKKDQFMTSKEFAILVEEEKKKRELAYAKKIALYEEAVAQRHMQIKHIQEEYREAINLRNEKISQAQETIQKDLVHLQKRYEQKVEKLETIMPLFFDISFSKYFGQPQLSFKSYNADTQELQLLLASEYNHYSQIIEFKAAPKIAKAIKTNITSVDPKMVYNINLNKKDHTFSMTFKKFTIAYKEQNYLAISTSHLQTIKPYSVKLTMAVPNTLLDDLSPHMQEIDQKSFIMPKHIALKPQLYLSISSPKDILEKKLSSYKQSALDPHKWLVVIGIEKYEQSDDIIYASRTACTFARVAQKVLGISKENSHILINQDASSGKISDALRDLEQQVQKGDKIYFYYNGHGIPNPMQSNEPYILPSDRLPEYVVEDNSFALESIYKTLLSTQAKNVFIFADTCFSGATDNKSIFEGTASARIVAKKVTIGSSRISIITAGKGTQFSNKYDKEHYRLMSYFLMDALLDGDKQIYSLFNTIKKPVYEMSRKRGRMYYQEPQFFGNKEALL